MGGGHHDEFAMCMSALGAAIDAAYSAREDAGARAAEGRQRQSAGLAVRPVSRRLVCILLIWRDLRRFLNALKRLP